MSPQEDAALSALEHTWLARAELTEAMGVLWDVGDPEAVKLIQSLAELDRALAIPIASLKAMHKRVEAS
jgi:hypothetical protein